MSLFMRNWNLAFAPLILAVTVVLAPGNARAAGMCRELSFGVALVAGGPKTERVAATLCVPPHDAHRNKSVEVLTHGASYNRSYWSAVPSVPWTSYVNAALAAGRATLAYDRLGSGTSSRPPAALLNVPVAAFVLHQVLNELRGPGHLFSDVTSTGHSMGSEIVNYEAATYHDVDRVVLTGFLHRNGEAIPEALASVYPALLDPKFAGTLTDPNYLTTLPGRRASFFLDARTTTATLVAADEADKDVLSGPELGDAIGRINTPAFANESRTIRAPVLMVIGDRDRMFCGAGLECTHPEALRAFERPYFPSAESFALYTLPVTGHSLTRHLTAPLAAVVIGAWIHSHP